MIAGTRREWSERLAWDARRNAEAAEQGCQEHDQEDDEEAKRKAAR